jgi:tetratricopeptide (TPR) repeat protein
MTTKRLWLAIVLIIISTTCLAYAQTDDDGTVIKRGNDLVAQAKYEAAIREYERVRPNANRYAQALYNIGVCHFELWQTQQAIEFYTRALREQPNYPRASYALGVALEDLGREASAREAYLKSIADSRGDFAPAQFRLGLLMLGKGDYSSGARLFREAIKRPGEHLPASHNNLGVVLASNGQLREAEFEFESALQLSSGALAVAAQNLELCRHLMAGENVKVAFFKVSEADGLARIAKSGSP